LNPFFQLTILKWWMCGRHLCEPRIIFYPKLVILHAINDLKVKKVDVNEQNPQAIGFYEHIRFEIINRSELDGLGKPYPILHMQLG